MKKGLLVLLFLVITLVFVGCDGVYFPDQTTNELDGTTSENTEDITESSLEIWKNSDDALDMNGDRKIDEVDYELYLLAYNYDYWRNSDDALDMNDDRKINEDDFEIYQLYNYFLYWKDSSEAEDLNDDQIIDEIDHEIYKNYEAWLTSNFAEDLNDDEVIDVDDFVIYQEYDQYIGTYMIRDYVYEGSEYYIIGDGIRFSNLAQYLEVITLSVNARGQVSVNIPANVQDIFGDVTDVILQATENMVITNLNLTTAIDTYVSIEGVEFNISLYLTNIENGFSTSYTIGFYDDNPKIYFNIIKVDNNG